MGPSSWSEQGGRYGTKGRERQKVIWACTQYFRTRRHPRWHPTGGDVSHEREVLDQAAALSLGRVCWAKHAPLAGVQRAGAAHLREGTSEVTTPCTHISVMN